MAEAALQLDLEERVGEAWGDVDMEGNGILDADEIAQVLAALGVDDLDEDTVFAELDEEGSGVIEWEAFSAWYVAMGLKNAVDGGDDEDDLGGLLDDLEDLGGTSTEDEDQDERQQQRRLRQEEEGDNEGDAEGTGDVNLADAMAGIDDLDLGGSDDDDEDADEDDLLDGLDDLEGMSDFSDSQDEDEAGSEAEQRQEQSDSPSLLERMKSANAIASQQSEEQDQARTVFSTPDGDDAGDAPESVSDRFGNDNARLDPTTPAPTGELAALSGGGDGSARANDLEGLRGAGLVGRRGNRFGQRSSLSVEELLVMDPNERSEEDVDVLLEWSRSVKGRYELF